MSPEAIERLGKLVVKLYAGWGRVPPEMAIEAYGEALRGRTWSVIELAFKRAVERSSEKDQPPSAPQMAKIARDIVPPFERSPDRLLAPTETGEPWPELPEDSTMAKRIRGLTETLAARQWPGFEKGGGR